MSRVLSHELHLRQIGTHAGIGNARSARAIDLQEGGIIPNDPSCQSVVFIRLTIPFPVDAEIQCEVGTEFPVILEISTHFALVVPVRVIPDGRVGNQRRILGTHDAIGLPDLINRAGKVVQDVFRVSGIRCAKACESTPGCRGVKNGRTCATPPQLSRVACNPDR